MGVELDVLVGHPEHELLFVAVQVARRWLEEPKSAGQPSRRVLRDIWSYHIRVYTKCRYLTKAP